MHRINAKRGRLRSNKLNNTNKNSGEKMLYLSTF